MRIVSLLPAATEMLVALGFESQIVGRSHECDSPESVQSIPICTRTPIDTRATSREIDQQVKNTLQAGLSLYELDLAQVQALQPDLIVTQNQSELCAISFAELEKQAANQLGAVKILSLSAQDVGGVWDDLRQVAQYLGVLDLGDRLIFRLQQRLAKIAGGVHATQRRVLCLEWLDPLMGMGNWVPELVEMAGGIPLLGQVGEHAEQINWEQIEAADPELIILSPCGFSLAQTQASLAALQSQPQWQALAAVQNKQVYLVDGKQYLNRPGPGLADSAEILAEIIHPADFDYGYRGQAWLPLEA